MNGYSGSHHLSGNGYWILDDVNDYRFFLLPFHIHRPRDQLAEKPYFSLILKIRSG